VFFLNHITQQLTYLEVIRRNIKNSEAAKKVRKKRGRLNFLCGTETLTCLKSDEGVVIYEPLTMKSERFNFIYFLYHS